MLIWLSFLANAFATTPAQRMTCANAVQYVRAHRHIYVQRGGELEDVYPIAPIGEPPSCLVHETFVYVLVPTLDQRDCHVGYQCRPAN